MVKRHGQIAVILGKQRRHHRIKYDQADEDAPSRLREESMQDQERDQAIGEDPADQQKIVDGSRKDGEKMNGSQSYPEIDLQKEKGDRKSVV